MNPHTITVSQSDIVQGQITDGGADMYDQGNHLATSLCPGQHIQPYTDDMRAEASTCFGPGASFRMDIGTALVLLLSENTGDSPLNISVSGELGGDKIANVRSNIEAAIANPYPITFDINNDQIVDGGSDMYEAVCHNHL